MSGKPRRPGSPAFLRGAAAVVALAALCLGAVACGDDADEADEGSVTTAAPTTTDTSTTDTSASDTSASDTPGGDTTTTAPDQGSASDGGGDDMPLILVTSPQAGAVVESPFTVEGTANTFEATVLYELLGPDGRMLTEGFTTATAGSGTRGDFSFEVEWSGGVTGEGTLVLFQENMESGGRQDVHEVPVRLS